MPPHPSLGMHSSPHHVYYLSMHARGMNECRHFTTSVVTSEEVGDVQLDRWAAQSTESDALPTPVWLEIDLGSLYVRGW